MVNITSPKQNKSVINVNSLISINKSIFRRTTMPNGNGKMVSNGVKSQECNNKRQARAQLKRIKWDLRFRGANQKRFYEAIENNDVTISVGPAGCGKTFLATH